jgi:pimeloyl-ACP methyl ester carboxylesterase
VSSLLNHQDSGAGRPVITFVHGLACALEDWQAQVAALAAAHRCISLDLPGHGASPAQGPLAIEDFGQRVADTVRGLDATPTVLVGHSMGCRVVLEAARRLDDGALGVVLVDGSLRGTGDAQAARAETRAAITDAGFEPYVRGLFEAMFTPQADAALRERIVRRALRLDPLAGTGLIADLAAWDAGRMEPVLAATRIPILVIQSTGVDAQRNRVPLQPGQSTPFVDKVLEHRPGTPVELIPGIGHFTMHEAADRVTDLVQAFAARVAGRA